MMKQEIRIYSQYYAGGNNAMSGRINDYVEGLKDNYNIRVISSFHVYPNNILKRFYRKIHRQDAVISIELFSAKTVNSGVMSRLLHYVIFSFSSFLHILFSTKPSKILVMSPPIFLPIFVMYAAKIRNIPYILEVHDLWPESIVQFGFLKRNSFIFSLLKTCERKIYVSAQNIIALTAGVQAGIADIIPQQSSKVSLLYFLAHKIQNISPNPFLPFQTRIQGRKIILFAGNMNEAYDFQKVRDFIVSKTAYFFVFIGDGSQQNYIQEHISGYENVLILPRMSKQEVERYIYYSDTIFIPLKDDIFYKGTFPVKGIEALVNEKEVFFWGPKDGEFSLFLEKLEKKEVSKNIFGKEYFTQQLSLLFS